MRRLPSKREILEKAIEIDMFREHSAGLPAIIPEEAELKESGVYHEARIALMTGPETQAKTQEKEMREYLHYTASELDLKVISRDIWRQSQRRIAGLRWKLRGLSIPSLLTPNLKDLKTSPTLQPQSKPVKEVSRVKIPAPRIPKIRAPKVPKKRPKKSPKKRARAGRVMRVQKPRIKDGVKSFAYPDHVWKVRPVRRKRKRSKRK